MRIREKRKRTWWESKRRTTSELLLSVGFKEENRRASSIVGNERGKYRRSFLYRWESEGNKEENTVGGSCTGGNQRGTQDFVGVLVMVGTREEEYIG